MSLSDRQKQTAQAFVDGYNEFTVEGMLARRSKDCIHKVRPASLQVPDESNEQYIEKYRPILPLLKNYKMTVIKMFSDPEAHTVVLHATGSAETPVGPYRNEYVFFMRMDEAGNELVEVEEHVDSAFVGEWFPKLLEYMKQRGDDTS